MNKLAIAFFVLGIFAFTATISLAIEEITATEYSSSGFKIIKVMTTPKKLNAIGKMSQFGDDNEVGKITDLGKNLPEEEQGEELVIKWSYNGTREIPIITLRLDYITGKDEKINVYTKTYTSIKTGKYVVVLKNIGNNYINNGEIAHWRVSLIMEEATVAFRESRMWGAFSNYAKMVQSQK